MRSRSQFVKRPAYENFSTTWIRGKCESSRAPARLTASAVTRRSPACSSRAATRAAPAPCPRLSGWTSTAYTWNGSPGSPMAAPTTPGTHATRYTAVRSISRRSASSSCKSGGKHARCSARRAGVSASVARRIVMALVPLRRFPARFGHRRRNVLPYGLLTPEPFQPLHVDRVGDVVGVDPVHQRRLVDPDVGPRVVDR